MIHKIYSNLPSFKNLELHTGLNILVSDKTPGSTDQQTRNRAGKTTVIKLIHFLLGGDCNNDSIFKHDKLIEYYFGMEFDLGDQRVCVERSGSDPNMIIIKKGDTSSWPIPARKENQKGNLFLSNTEWKVNLGNIIFSTGESKKRDKNTKYTPTFRSLISYFVRREYDNAFGTPYEQSKDQKRWDWQVALSFLLGIDWKISRKWQLVRDKEKALKELKKGIGEGLFDSIIGTVKNLRTDLAIAESSTKELKEQLKNFRVHKQYYKLEEEASTLTLQMNKLADQNVINNQLIKELDDSLSSEQPPPVDSVDKLYKEAGIVLPNNVSKRYEDLLKFHNTIIENRKTYIEQELEKAKENIEKNNENLKKLSERQSEVMNILQSHGALDQYYKLQEELTKKEANVESIKNRYNAAKQLESQTTLFEIERKQLLVSLTRDFQEQNEKLNKAILAFEKFSKSLYEEAGSLTIDESINGPNFEFRIQGEKSRGVNNMQIFCFDMVLTKLIHERKLGPGFVVHDSHLFDATEERQVAKALKVGLNLANELGIQYIVSFNTDDLNKFSPHLFDASKYVLPQKLTDAREDGGLFGIRF
ncbi:DUF2326 domain-containing protein [Candidatus Woesearchaeota archaeon CG_4_10_14_0_2_um_filter_33_10]|nr:MAG: hypothetical protein AUJ83_04900 [Candidatus Woesearchaeota archaeon CG1_02_33_12]PIU72899.1 MAG: DUF2326 domain-containing protein [Candidatus Woesearchaeota archaeon CG06_land_8_20_14_3_00_33_13]PIZ53258.1 MAG: DUF2326 domain-containing protein [Candidatus Woesearchaeota archaeon CG_4_10_14_0_2_um_filter_33_10]